MRIFDRIFLSCSTERKKAKERDKERTQTSRGVAGTAGGAARQAGATRARARARAGARARAREPGLAGTRQAVLGARCSLRARAMVRRSRERTQGALFSSRVVPFEDYGEVAKGCRCKVVMLAHMGARSDVVGKFAAAWRAAGAAPRLAVYPAMANMWFEGMARALAHQVLRVLSSLALRANIKHNLV